MSTQLSASVLARLDVLLDRDPAATVAVDAFYAVTAKLEHIDPELFAELDGAWCTLFDCLRVAFWRDGWQCGTNPALLVFEQETDPEPVPFEWRDVPGVDGVSIALSVDTVVSQILAGGAE